MKSRKKQAHQHRRSKQPKKKKNVVWYQYVKKDVAWIVKKQINLIKWLNGLGVVVEGSHEHFLRDITRGNQKQNAMKCGWDDGYPHIFILSTTNGPHPKYNGCAVYLFPGGNTFYRKSLSQNGFVVLEFPESASVGDIQLVINSKYLGWSKDKKPSFVFGGKKL